MSSRGRGRGRGRGRRGRWRSGGATHPHERGSHSTTKLEADTRHLLSDSQSSRKLQSASSSSSNQHKYDEQMEKDMAIVGLCMDMCSLNEQHERQRTMEISRFERFDGNGSSLSIIAVKKYRRPAAGRIEINPRELRPPHVLLQTLRHLFTTVLSWPKCGFDWQVGPAKVDEHGKKNATDRTEVEFLALYQFLSDRIRSIRQDFTIQRTADVSLVQALEQIARFYILASFQALRLVRLSQHYQEWSEKLNQEQLASALAELQALYQQHQRSSTTSGVVSVDQDVLKNQAEIISYDILLHIDDPRAVTLMLMKVPPQLLHAQAIQRALKLFIAQQMNDFHQFSKLYRLATPLEKMLLLPTLPSVWQKTLEMMTKAFGKQDRFPLEDLMEFMYLLDREQAIKLCKSINVHLEELEPSPRTAKAEVSESWEDEVDITKLSEDEVRVVIRFKAKPLHDAMDQETLHMLLVETANSIHTQDILPILTASELIIGTDQAPPH